MRNQDVVSHDPSLPARVTLGALGAVAGASRGEQTGAVPEDARAPRLVEGDPVLALRHGLEQNARVVGEVGNELLLVQHAEVALVELIGKIPVEERDHGGDAGIEEVVDELDVVIQTLLVDGVVAATERDNARPGDGKAVSLGAGLLQELNVLRNAVVGVAGDITRAAASDLAWDLAERVPDGWPTAVSIRSTLNLVARRLLVSMGSSCVTAQGRNSELRRTKQLRSPKGNPWAEPPWLGLGSPWRSEWGLILLVSMRVLSMNRRYKQRSR